MSDRADAHIHLFENSYWASFASRPGVTIDEVACYESLMANHDVKAALIVGQTDPEMVRKNTEFLKRVGPDLDWAYPAAHLADSAAADTDWLKSLRDHGFIGVSMYNFDEASTAEVLAVSDEAWQWIAEHKWLISVNSEGENWRAWAKVLDRHTELRVIISHCGLPPAQAQAPSENVACKALDTVLDLAKYPQTRVKLSGFYAMTDPGYDYPHEAAWPYVQQLKQTFGVPRLLWASDFSPHLDLVSFSQTYGLFAKMPFLSDDDCTAIEGVNLLALLHEARG
jgi:L-fuconolactonase